MPERDEVLESIAQKMAVGLWEKCRCHEGFKDRGRVDPSCHFCAVGPEDAQVSGLAWAEGLEREGVNGPYNRDWRDGWNDAVRYMREVCGEESK